MIRTLNRNLLIAIVVLLGGLVAFFVYNGRYFTSFFQGAHTTSPAQLALMNAATAKDRFVVIKAASVVPTGVEHVTKDDSHPEGYVDSQYLLATVDGRSLVVRAAPAVAANDTKETSFEGRLVPMSNPLHTLLSGKDGASDNPAFLPFYLDTEDYKTFGYTSLIIGVPILLLGCWMLWRFLQTSGDYSHHAFARRLAKYGQLEMLVQQIDAETAGAHTTFKKGMNSAELTPHWLIAKTAAAATPMRLDSVVWVYRRIVKRKLYFVITIGKTHSLVAFDRLGQKLAIELKDAQTGEILRDIAAAAPQAIHGYDKGLEKLWRATKDKSAFLAAAQPQFAGSALGEQSSTMWRV